jgi:hypothetical protein
LNLTKLLTADGKPMVELSGIEPLTSSLRIANSSFNSLSYVTFNFEMPRCTLIILRMVSTTDSYLPIEISFPENDGSSEISLAVTLRDTMLLTPATSKSLSSIGDLLGKPKIILDADPIKEQFYKENMSQLRRENWELFKQYALTDAEICAAYQVVIQG